MTSTPVPAFLADLADQLGGELSIHDGIWYVSVPTGHFESVVVGPNVDSDGDQIVPAVVDGNDPQYLISTNVGDATGVGDDVLRAVVTESLVRGAAQGIIDQIYDNGAKADHDMGVCGTTGCKFCEANAKDPAASGPQKVYRKLAELYVRRGKNDRDQGRYDGLFDAYCTMTGADPEMVHEGLEGYAQALHDEMIASMESERWGNGSNGWPVRSGGGWRFCGCGPSPPGAAATRTSSSPRALWWRSCLASPATRCSPKASWSRPRGLPPRRWPDCGAGPNTATSSTSGCGRRRGATDTSKASPTPRQPSSTTNKKENRHDVNQMVVRGSGRHRACHR